jgi:hypothetical protein
MATWSLLLGAVVNLVALLLFGVAYRAPADHALRMERAALGGVVAVVALSLVGPARLAAVGAYDFVQSYYFGTSYVAYTPGPLARLMLVRALALHAALVPIPVAAWLGLVALRRSRAEP